jgi:hypothetical protein
MLAVHPYEHARFAEDLTLDTALLELSKAVDGQDAPRATALFDYLARSKDRERLIRALPLHRRSGKGIPTCRVTPCPTRRSTSTALTRRTCATRSSAPGTRYVSRVRKRSYEFNCFELYREVLSLR